MDAPMILARYSLYVDWVSWIYVAVIIAVDETHFTDPIVLSMN